MDWFEFFKHLVKHPLWGPVDSELVPVTVTGLPQGWTLRRLGPAGGRRPGVRVSLVTLQGLVVCGAAPPSLPMSSFPTGFNRALSFCLFYGFLTSLRPFKQ